MQRAAYLVTMLAVFMAVSACGEDGPVEVSYPSVIGLYIGSLTHVGVSAGEVVLDVTCDGAIDIHSQDRDSISGMVTMDFALYVPSRPCGGNFGLGGQGTVTLDSRVRFEMVQWGDGCTGDPAFTGVLVADTLRLNSSMVCDGVTRTLEFVGVR